MNRKAFFKSIVGLPLLSLCGFSNKRKESPLKVVNSKGTLEKYSPRDQWIDTFFGKTYRMVVVVTKNILIPFIADDGTKLWETNKYGEHIKICASCTCGDTNRTDCVHKRFESQVLYDGEVTDEMYEMFINKVKENFEDHLKGVKNLASFHTYIVVYHII